MCVAFFFFNGQRTSAGYRFRLLLRSSRCLVEFSPRRRNENTEKTETVRGKVRNVKTKRSGENRHEKYADRTERDGQTNVTTERKEREIERQTEENWRRERKRERERERMSGREKETPIEKKKRKINIESVIYNSFPYDNSKYREWEIERKKERERERERERKKQRKKKLLYWRTHARAHVTECFEDVEHDDRSVVTVKRVALFSLRRWVEIIWVTIRSLRDYICAGEARELGEASRSKKNIYIYKKNIT